MVDDEDFKKFSVFNWQAKRVKGSELVYASRGVWDGSKQRTLRLHTAIMGPGRIDHQDGDGLNCQRHNLRFATALENAQNRRKYARSKCRWKGVYFRASRDFFEGYITLDGGVRKFLGCFKSELEAADAYDVAALKHFGKFARLNFPVLGEQQMARNSGQPNRNLFPSHGAGKGSKPRSRFDQTWREHHDEIDWSGSVMGWERLGPGREIKRYGPPVTDEVEFIHGGLKT